MPTRTIMNPAENPAHDAFVEKKSEFIGDACHIQSLDDALAFVETIREMHPKSRHVAYAAIMSDDGRLMERMSDDGEPSGTAGKPILDVLRANDLTDCVITVTRYFGGILLGSGGLIRAYSTGASIAVKAATIAQITVCERFDCTLEYTQYGVFQQIVAGANGVQEDAQFTDHIQVTVNIPQDKSEQFLHQITESFNATVTPQRLGEVHRYI